MIFKGEIDKKLCEITGFNLFWELVHIDSKVQTLQTKSNFWKANKSVWDQGTEEFLFGTFSFFVSFSFTFLNIFI